MFYEFTANTLQGKPYAFSNLKGKVVLVVNTASKCGLTPQYEGLQQLHQELYGDGLEIIGFPCNQFGQQEPGSASDIQQGCLINYGVDFTMMEKIDVNGEHAHPIYQYLKTALPGLLTNNIKWNFTKFLIGKDGQPLKRYAPTTKPEKIKADIIQALQSS
ncbi:MULTISPECIES: glutathione peroxidase [Pseudoalteromonas]|uniref:Glutathione peroxidase n=1 Tax=Pseudoalteromonas luteoviolacea (strain 2ta16) TaxID=1353533 RepID=V4HZB7_PSEL2|nr:MULTISPECIES: glutathione peroxidase [Pseudoalteromonas]ESP95153.1 glutathione peroxidase [Pseudoalteromonas luteoviolacea 2ta16]KZN42325.1 Gpo [Pseudoalteromonas luteoviolacea NCIMB 1944]MCG7547177.1 glutathione peroxidase [Pseudoalteromonas sp. Of7M-16]